MNDGKTRCPWARDELEIAYHDQEWGVPCHEDRKLFEMLVLEGLQAGLSWNLILRRREGLRDAFDGFDPELVASYDSERQARLLRDPRIIRNRRKVEAAVGNARAFLEVQREFGSFDKFIWSFVGGAPVRNRFASMEEVPASTPVSEAMSRELRRRGFRFVGPTICYSFMQAVGMVDDHLETCFLRAGERHGERATR